MKKPKKKQVLISPSRLYKLDNKQLDSWTTAFFLPQGRGDTESKISLLPGEGVSKVKLLYAIISAPTGESVGSKDVTKSEPTDLPVGAIKNEGSTDF